MAKTKKIVRREWTKDDVKTLKSMARRTPVCTENLNPDIVVMKSAKQCD